MVEDLSMHEKAKKAPKKHMNIHLILWIATLISFIFFIIAALIRVFSLLK